MNKLTGYSAEFSPSDFCKTKGEIAKGRRMEYNITEDHVSFETAKLLKEKGFDESVTHYYFTQITYIGFKDYPTGILYTDSDPQHQNNYKNKVAAPTQALVMKWLREVHYIIFVFKPSCFSGNECTYWSYERWCGDNFDGEVLSFKTYEEAVEAALKYALENLI